MHFNANVMFLWLVLEIPSLLTFHGKDPRFASHLVLFHGNMAIEQTESVLLADEKKNLIALGGFLCSEL